MYINEVENIVGLSKKSIRYYEDIIMKILIN